MDGDLVCASDTDVDFVSVSDTDGAIVCVSGQANGAKADIKPTTNITYSFSV
jgi:hypothetical protein